jgi:hypothetical protein
MSVENLGRMISTGGKHLLRAPKLFGSPTNSHLLAKQEELAKDMYLALPSIFVHTWKGSLALRKI